MIEQKRKVQRQFDTNDFKVKTDQQYKGFSIKKLSLKRINISLYAGR